MTTTIILHGHSVIVQVYVVSAIGVRASITVGFGLFHKVLQLRIAHLGRNVHALVHLFWAMKLQRVALFVGCWESVQTEKLTAESKLNVVLLHGFAALDDFSREVLNGEVNICEPSVDVVRIPFSESTITVDLSVDRPAQNGELELAVSDVHVSIDHGHHGPPDTSINGDFLVGESEQLEDEAHGRLNFSFRRRHYEHALVDFHVYVVESALVHQGLRRWFQFFVQTSVGL
mmetsp:Transcript_49201/g.73154  ORF Transcript_49201/g.73154 Transcript_49201/m.73154 type:complete len:231 (+) Transcript_49201:1214-1906(+)